MPWHPNGQRMTPEELLAHYARRDEQARQAPYATLENEKRKAAGYAWNICELFAAEEAVKEHEAAELRDLQVAKLKAEIALLEDQRRRLEDEE